MLHHPSGEKLLPKAILNVPSTYGCHPQSYNLPILRPASTQLHVSLQRSAHICLWWWSLLPITLQQPGLHQPPETLFTSDFPEVSGLNRAVGLSRGSYRKVKGTKWVFPSNLEAPAWASSMLVMTTEPHTQMMSSLGNSGFGSLVWLVSFFGFFSLSLSPFSILDFELPYHVFLSAWLHHSWQVRLAWIEGNTKNISHSTPAAGRTCSQQRLQTPVKSNKDLHHWRGRNYNCDYSCWNRGHCISCFRGKSECCGASQKEVSFVHSTEHWARAAQQGSTADCSKEKMPRGFFLVVVTQYIHSIHMERGRRDLLLHDGATAMWGTGIWGPCGQHQGAAILNMEDLNLASLLGALKQY